MEILKYEGSNFFRQRILLATLSGRSVKITEFEDGISGECINIWWNIKFILIFKIIKHAYLCKQNVFIFSIIL